MSDLQLDSIVLPCADLPRQRAFYERILETKPGFERADWVRFDLGPVRLALRARGDALFPRASGDAGVQISFRVTDADTLDRWHRRLLTARVAVLEPPTKKPWGHRTLYASDPEGNVIAIFCDQTP